MRSSSRPAARRRTSLLAAVIATLACAAVLAACGGGDDNEGASSGATGSSGASETSTPAATSNAAAPKGEPIKTMTIAAVNWNGSAYPNILETAKLYEKYVNDRGGIKGRPLRVTVCDEMGDPNQLATCGRKAASEGDVAVVGSFTLTGDRIVPILENEKISWFGICCPVYPAELNSPITFAFGPGQAGSVAYAKKAVDLGCKEIALVVSDTPTKTITKGLVEGALAQSGLKLKQFVAIPVAAQDYSPQVAQATNGTDCIIGGISETAWGSFMPSFAQSGSTAKLIGAQGNLDEKVAKDFPKVTEGDVIIAYYPDISDKAFADYREAIAQYKPPSDLDYNSLGGLGTWTAYTAFKDIVEKMDGPINHATFLEAARKTKALDTGGKTPPLDLTKPWGDEAPAGSERLFTRSVTFATFDDKGKLHSDGSGFEDMTDLLVKATSKR